MFPLEGRGFFWVLESVIGALEERNLDMFFLSCHFKFLGIKSLVLNLDPDLVSPESLDSGSATLLCVCVIYVCLPVTDWGAV
jgi:hypothetical protein